MNDIIELCKVEMYKKFPNAAHTIRILLWDDGDYEIRAVHGNDDDKLIHNFTYYSQEPYVKYNTERMVSGAVKYDELGNEYYVPEELIKFLQEPEKYN